MESPTKKEYGKLVLSVDLDEPVMIGDDIIIIFQKKQSGRRAKIVIIAPKNMRITRPNGAV